MVVVVVIVIAAAVILDAGVVLRNRHHPTSHKPSRNTWVGVGAEISNTFGIVNGSREQAILPCVEREAAKSDRER